MDKNTYFERREESLYYTFICPVLSERFSEHKDDWFKAKIPYIAQRIVDYLILRGKSEELENIKRRLNIMGLKHNAYKDLAKDIGFLVLVLKTIADDKFEFKKTTNVQVCAGNVAKGFERLLEQ